MKKFEEMGWQEQKEVAGLFANWLSAYTHEVIVKVLAKRDEILNNEFAMGLLQQLKERSDKERDEFALSIQFMMDDFGSFSKYDPHNHGLTHAISYRDVLYDLYIRD